MVTSGRLAVPVGRVRHLVLLEEAGRLVLVPFCLLVDPGRDLMRSPATPEMLVAPSVLLSVLVHVTRVRHALRPRGL